MLPRWEAQARRGEAAAAPCNQGTPLEQMYLRGEYTPLSLEDYINILVRQLEVLPPETVIERITGDGKAGELIAPLWSATNSEYWAQLTKPLRERHLAGQVLLPIDRALGWFKRAVAIRKLLQLLLTLLKKCAL